MNMKYGYNPIMGMDLPDPDIIFVDDVFYMINTTMHFFPGGEILRSYNLVDWEHASYVFDELDGTDAQRLNGKENIYGKGMWAGSLRYNKGMFYLVFSCNDTHKTYIYRSPEIDGKWVRNDIEGWYYDPSLFFDDDDKIYMAHGHRQVYITELNSEITGPKAGGLNRLILDDKDNPVLGYEGSHLYKIAGRYYLFNIHSEKSRWHRVESLFTADDLSGEFVGGDILNQDLSDRGDGLAQGGIVEGPEGVWHGFMFRDNGAVGRIPVITEAKFTDKGLVLHAQECFETPDLKPGYPYEPLVRSDDFKSDKLETCWTFNHMPDLSLVSWGDGSLKIKTDKICGDLCEAKNTLTQRMRLPNCAAEITIDGSSLNPGDTAGLCALQGSYVYIGLKRTVNGFLIVTGTRDGVIETKEAETNEIRVRIEGSFGNEDKADCYIKNGEEKIPFGKEHELKFTLDHFTGARFGLFTFSEDKVGGTGIFRDFIYE